MSHLVACPTCARHVRASDPLCVFCGGALSAALREAPAPRAPVAKLARAALYALSVGAVAVPAVGACSHDDSTSNLVPPYGVSPPGAPAVGEACDEGNVYVTDGTSGYLFCDSETGTWAYSAEVPTGYTLDSALESSDGLEASSSDEGSTDSSDEGSTDATSEESSDESSSDESSSSTEESSSDEASSEGSSDTH